MAAAAAAACDAASSRAGRKHPRRLPQRSLCRLRRTPQSPSSSTSTGLAATTPAVAIPAAAARS